MNNNVFQLISAPRKALSVMFFSLCFTAAISKLFDSSTGNSVYILRAEVPSIFLEKSSRLF